MAKNNFMEVWRNIPSFSNYQASTLGRIRQVKRKKIRKFSSTSDGYYQISLRNDLGHRRPIFVHRLIAITFLGQPTKERNFVDNINRIPIDNRVVNLRWVSFGENMENRFKRGIITIERIIELYKMGLSPQQIVERVLYFRSIFLLRFSCGYSPGGRGVHAPAFAFAQRAPSMAPMILVGVISMIVIPVINDHT